MYKKLSYITLSLMLTATAFAKPKIHDFLPVRSPDPVFSEIPQTLEAFLNLRDKLAYTPEGGATVFVIAMLVFTRNESLGKQCFTIALDNSQLMKNTGGYKGYSPTDGFKYYYSRLRDYPYIPFSYIQGTSPEQAYALPQSSFVCQYSTNPFAQPDENTVKLQISSTGTDSPRPITVVKNNRGVWKVKDFVSLFGTVSPPQKDRDDDL